MISIAQLDQLTPTQVRAQYEWFALTATPIPRWLDVELRKRLPVDDPRRIAGDQVAGR